MALKNSKVSAKSKALTQQTFKPSKASDSAVGAPSQHNQGTRKGKRAWRKNIDIDEIEDGLEGLRTEERVTGTVLQKKQDDELFQIDVKGDDKIRKQLPRFSTKQLTSTKVLSQRSAVPAVFSRPTTLQKRKLGASLSHEEKARLLRTGKRIRRGPLNSIMDPTEFTSGSTIVGLSKAVKESGSYDPWSSTEATETVEGDGFEPPKKVKVKAPNHANPRDSIDLPAVPMPHPGMSYNPPASAHHELLLKAHEIEEEREKKATKLAEAKAKIEQANGTVQDVDQGVALGMTIGLVNSETESENADEDDGITHSKKLPERKTKQQRRKAAKLQAEKRLLAEKAFRKRLLESVNSAKNIWRTTKQTVAAREQAREERQRALKEKLAKLGLAGKKLGRHRVPEGEVDVQLGEELSENLRGLKPEGNLFRDRFLSLQHRALIEPRVPTLPKKRSAGKEYEKHPWKRFE